MAKFFTTCPVCKGKRKLEDKSHKSFFIDYRNFVLPGKNEIMKSKEEMCSWCAKNIRKMLQANT